MDLPALTLIVGGARSGKSGFAERLVTGSGRPRLYLATAQSFDAEMDEKIALHKTQRGPDWTTIEAPFDAARVLGECRPEQAVLLDCATLWLSNHLLAEHDLAIEAAKLFAALAACPAPVVIVSNEVGAGIVPDNALSRQFRNAQGLLNQRLAAQSNLVVTIIAGLPLVLKGQLTEAHP